MTERPDYDSYSDMSESRGPLADAFAQQVLATTGPWLDQPANTLNVLDLGCGYGGTTLALSRRCHFVVGMEPAELLFKRAQEALADQGRGNVELRRAGVEELTELNVYDLIVLDNVYEHLPDQQRALMAIHRALKPGGVLFLLTPNKLWPIEAHYGLPGLAWLPLPLADRYLRMTGRGTSYQDASYAPTYWQLRRALGNGGWQFDFVIPGDRSATLAGSPWHYRLGMAALSRFPWLWCISKALLVVARKPLSTSRSPARTQSPGRAGSRRGRRCASRSRGRRRSC